MRDLRPPPPPSSVPFSLAVSDAVIFCEESEDERDDNDDDDEERDDPVDEEDDEDEDDEAVSAISSVVRRSPGLGVVGRSDSSCSLFSVVVVVCFCCWASISWACWRRCST